MAPLDLFRRESLTAKEQQAFKALADTLIFEAPNDISLSKKNIPALSQKLQSSFREQDETHYVESQTYMRDQMLRAFKSLESYIDKNGKGSPSAKPDEDKPLDLPPPKQEQMWKRPLTAQAFADAAEFFVLRCAVDDSFGYGAWGFTPKLAAMRTKDTDFVFGKDGKNCFGVVQALGALVSDMGLPFEMGITIDHPFAIVYVEGKTFLASLYGVHEAKGTFETREGYKMYKPSPEDNLPYTLMTVWNFDEALVYELLENFEVLRQMSLGNKVENLPGTEERGMKIAAQYKDVLQGAPWRDMQKKLVPRLAGYFRDEHSAWAMEQEQRRLVRELQRLFSHITAAAQTATSLSAEPFESFREKFLPKAKIHSRAIQDFISSGTEFNASVVPEDVVLFFKKTKEELSAIESGELRDKVEEAVLRPFLGGER